MTLSGFYTAVLRELGVVPPNGTAEPEDRQRVVDTYALVHAMLLQRGLAKWGVTESIPNEYATQTVKMTAYQLTSDFAVPDTKYVLLKQEGEIDANPPSWAERSLRKMQDLEYVSATLANNYF